MGGRNFSMSGFGKLPVRSGDGGDVPRIPSHGAPGSQENMAKTRCTTVDTVPYGVAHFHQRETRLSSLQLEGFRLSRSMLSRSDVGGLFKKYDTNKDGVLSQAEFEAFVASNSNILVRTLSCYPYWPTILT